MEVLSFLGNSLRGTCQQSSAQLGKNNAFAELPVRNLRLAEF